MPTPVPRLLQRVADGGHQSVAGEEDPGAALDPAIPDAPGDEAPAGTPGTGESICRVCGGTGSSDDGGACPGCDGRGKVVQGVGGG